MLCYFGIAMAVFVSALTLYAVGSAKNMGKNKMPEWKGPGPRPPWHHTFINKY